MHRYWHDAMMQVDDFTNEGVVASGSWPFQVNLLKSKGAPIASTIPAEGATGWADTTMLHADAEHPELRLPVAGALALAQGAGRSRRLVRLGPLGARRLQGQRAADRRGLRHQRLRQFREDPLLAHAGRQVRDARQPAACPTTAGSPTTSRSSAGGETPVRAHSDERDRVPRRRRAPSARCAPSTRVSFEIADGEFFAMLGPSGSGKTTCLRLIAGFEQPDAGAILLHGRPMQGVPPYDRPVNTVFQDYALFPHMSVLDNVAYGLMVRGMAKAERHRKAQAMLELVALGGMAPRRPSQLSGGQRQRVALARALVLEPEVLLLDEPLGALDLKLRQQMQGELKALQRKVGITFVFVTHDQDEALGMADRVAVFNQGRIEQIGTAEEVYERPATAFVAGFVGSSNIVDAATAERLFGRRRRLRAAAGADRRSTAPARSRSRAPWSRPSITAPARAWTWRSTAARCWSSTAPTTARAATGRRASGSGSAGRPRRCSRCASRDDRASPPAPPRGGCRPGSGGTATG